MLLAHTAAGPIYIFDRPVRMLVVDDDPILREFALGQLAMPGGTIVTAEDGEEAWAILEREEAFDLLLTDLDMPKLDGFGLLDMVRRSARHCHLPVVVITSREDIFAIDRAYEIGATSFVTKPVNWRLLGYQLRYVLRAGRVEAQVRSARDEAERAATLKNNLLTLIQHETRTPLHVIMGYAELLQQPSAGGAPEEYVHGMLGAAKDLNELLRRIFYFAQISAGTLPMDRELVPLSHLVEETVHSLQAKAAQAGVAIRVSDEGAGAALTRCDMCHLSTALREVILNAILQEPPGSTIDIDLTLAPAGAVVTIKDHGAGLAGEALVHCCEPFAQSHDPLTRAAHGLGLGLPTARRVIELHGGRLELVSVPEEGTSARILLPLAPEERRLSA
jgi:signal transduction histidine kinase